MALTPSPPPLPLIITYNFKQLWLFLSIAVFIKLLCGHWTDVCSQGRSQYVANRQSFWARYPSVRFYSVLIIKTLNK